MQGSSSLPAALSSSKWIAAFLVKHRNDDDIYVRTPERKSKDDDKILEPREYLADSASARSSENEVKFQGFYHKATAEMRGVFRSTKSSNDSVQDVEQASNEEAKSTPEQRAKSAWAFLFDTKSGNKLHKRTQSAPTTHYVPHVLETIGEEQEEQECSALKSFVNAAKESEDDRKIATTTPQESTDRVAHDGDNASIRTTCTVIIRQATLNDIAEEACVNTDNIQTSTTHDVQKPKSVSFDIRSSQGSRKVSPIECRGSIITPSMMSEQGTSTPETPKKKKKKTSSISSSIFSFVGKVVRLGRSSPSVKKANKARRHEPRDELPNSEASNNLRPILKWNLPQDDNAMGDLIRNFSGPLTPPDSLDTSTPPPSAKYGRNFSDLSAFDKSIEDLMPIPAKRPTSGRVISDSESMPEFDDTINNPRLRPRGKHVIQNANHDDSTVMSDEEVHVTPVHETLSQAYARHQDCYRRIKAMYDRNGIDRTGKLLACESKQREEVEQRQVREMTEDLEQPPQEIQTGEQEENEPLPQETVVSEKTAPSNPSNPTTPSHDGAQERADVNEEPIMESIEHDFTAPDATAAVSTQNPQNPHDEQPADQEPDTAATHTNDTSSTSTWSQNGDIHLPLGATLTRAAMVHHENEEYSAFFKSLQNVREKSPDRFCGRQGSFSVRAWLDQTYEHEHEMARDRAALKFFHGPHSTTENEDDTLSDLGYFPSLDETRAALNHPDAPKIRGSSPKEAMRIWNADVKSLEVANMKKETLQAEVKSSLTRNELIEDEEDRAERVTYLYLQKKLKAQVSDEDKATHLRHVRKVCREFEKALEVVQKRAALANKEATDAEICVEYLQRSYHEMEENIHRFTESLGYKRADNLVDAMELVKKTEREENIDIREVQRLDIAEPESPDSYGATEWCAGQAQGDNNVGPEDPTDIFF
ncbi:hypothetical protein HYE68_005548 [Fusarium pseudograminearum]|nr:hypothetical protein HYE68_005548 [Fusarium pseudograminearum]